VRCCLGHERGRLSFAKDISGYDAGSKRTGLDELDYYFVHDDEKQTLQTIVGGYQLLPLSLAQRAEKSGAAIATSERLVSCARRRLVSSSPLAIPRPARNARKRPR